MSAVTALGTANPSANPTTSLTVTTGAQIPAGAKVIVSASLLVTTPVVACAVNGIAAQQVWFENRTTAIGIWTFYFDAFNAIESGATITVTFAGTSGPGGVMNACYVTGLVAGPPDVSAVGQGSSTAVSTTATATPPSTTADYFAYAAYGIANSTAGTTTGNSYNALAEVIQGVRVIKQEEAWKDLTHPVAAATETWTDGATGAFAAGISLWQQGSFMIPMREKSQIAPIYLRGNV